MQARGSSLEANAAVQARNEPYYTSNLEELAVVRKGARSSMTLSISPMRSIVTFEELKTVKSGWGIGKGVALNRLF